MNLIKKDNSYHFHVIIDQQGYYTVIDDRKGDWKDFVDSATESVVPIKVNV